MPDKHQIDRIGVNAVEKAFLQMGWLFREQPVSDYGIDALAEPKEDDKPTGELIAIQIKTGKSYFRRRGTNFVFHGVQRHLDYWLNHSLPVFIILHNPESDLTIWQRVERHLITIHKSDKWSIDIPSNQVLDPHAAEYIRCGISSDPAPVRRLRLALDLPLIREISKQLAVDSVFLTIDEWVNKTLNFRESNIRFSDPDNEPTYRLETWLPMADIHEFMDVYFPWLDYEYAREIEDYSAEIEQHVLEVSMSNLGQAVLEVERYVERG